MQILSSNLASAKDFYESVGVLRSNYSTPEISELGVCPTCIIVDQYRNREEQVILAQYPAFAPASLIDRIVFRVSDTKKLEHYLSSQGVGISSAASALSYFEIADPEGHQIGFLQQSRNEGWTKDMIPVRPRIIHTGIVVKDRPAMEHFYRDILGFRPYWHGGRTDDQDDWVSLQVPDGSDWVEFMLNVPGDADKHQLGGANHIALGVTDIQAAKTQLIKNGVTLTEEPKIGRGGKWQLNVYDPDGTRVEFMEFAPVQKPCCSEYTAPHPKP